MVNLRARDYSPGTGRFAQRDTVIPNGPATQGYNGSSYAADNPTTLTDPSGHSAVGVVVDASLASGILTLTYGAEISAAAGLAGIAVPVVAVFLLLAVVFTVLLLLFELATGCNLGLLTMTCGGTAHGEGVANWVGRTLQTAMAVSGVTQVVEEAKKTEKTIVDTWDTIWQRDKDAGKKNAPDPEPTQQPEPTRVPPVPPLPPGGKSGEQQCRDAGLAWFPGNADYGHILDNHSGPPGIKGRGYFFKGAFANGYEKLNGYIKATLTAPAFVAFQVSGAYIADCYFEGPVGGIGKPVGKASDHSTESQTLGVALNLTRYVVSAYPCDEPRVDGNLVRGACRNRPKGVAPWSS